VGVREVCLCGGREIWGFESEDVAGLEGQVPAFFADVERGWGTGWLVLYGFRSV
jgi:hypothetical protein